ncbi:uncharacterized protein DUF2645 [Xenorhabdus cabanillasii]|uniref:Uncharacterized protein DUF2645 n=1 Tax=Xenorhabdus cabanillasii TaxID=351673 RepID=A0A3D9UGZ1_9GAMM|nr:DUF2645 family protein [Xenorhabdus cabanillasii]REF28557.1 uncharacterized protein DUF2645 [Xenorhabdus cabanillasii]
MSMKIINILACITFILFSTILIGCLSTVDFEWTIGEEGINTICDVVSSFVINDDRILTAPLCLFFSIAIYVGICSERHQSIFTV